MPLELIELIAVKCHNRSNLYVEHTGRGLMVCNSCNYTQYGT